MDYLNKCEDIKALLLNEKVSFLNDKTQMHEMRNKILHLFLLFEFLLKHHQKGHHYPLVVLLGKKQFVQKYAHFQTCNSRIQLMFAIKIIAKEMKKRYVDLVFPDYKNNNLNLNSELKKYKFLQLITFSSLPTLIKAAIALSKSEIL